MSEEEIHSHLSNIKRILAGALTVSHPDYAEIDWIDLFIDELRVIVLTEDSRTRENKAISNLLYSHIEEYVILREKLEGK